VVVAAFALIWAFSSKPDWSASGDGKTIFNTRTGELRYTASGRSVSEVNAERAAAYEANQEQYKIDQEKRDQEGISRTLVKEQKTNAIRSHNSAIYFRVKKFVDDHPKIVPTYEWEHVTRPFRTGMLLTRNEHSNLLDFLGRAVINEPHRSDASFSDAIGELKKWDFSNTW